MSVPMVFVISAPRSGSTMLERMLEGHSLIHGGPEPHLLTPLAHLGVWANVDKAPYDHVLAAESQKLFISKLPGGESDYWKACRAYCDTLYGAYIAGSGKHICLDKTPAYALILPFIAKVFPDAKYVVLTRHPLAVFSSYANSFFDGNYQAAQNYNPLLNRYVPAIADFLRRDYPQVFHVRYEDLVRKPELWMQEICAYIGVPYEPAMVNYGERPGTAHSDGLGDPIGVTQHDRPQTGSIEKWASELVADPLKLSMMRAIVDRLAEEDLTVWGYPPASFWEALEQVQGKSVASRASGLTRYRLQRKLIVGLRAQAQKGGMFRGVLSKARLVCDVLLRE
ncbi:MAG: hypothetical protein AMXMBFR84_22480 [Candidatus Hydrogenedentota bacterium]